MELILDVLSCFEDFFFVAGRGIQISFTGSEMISFS